ncbi:MAG TPA: M23 family metallopeptidase [Candidatus Sulfotelmatobacter sp.]|nr:M23 family metallopeptidase [Candidatus Sulfotelmatobacter sp.]
MVDAALQITLVVVSFGAIFVAVRYARPLTVAATIGALLVAEIVALNAGAPLSIAASAAIAVEIGLVAVWWYRARAGIRAWRAEARATPLLLRSPFVDRWRVAAGGPLPGRNHHLLAGDQRFAYDFVHVGGRCLGEPILAPCAGTVVAAVDELPDLPPSMNPNRPGIAGRELGNHVGIQTGGTTVFLCHLQRGSLTVAAGDHVAAGTQIGRCGNSGRTTRPHLHLHAQDRPVYALRVARGVPVAFIDAGTARVLEFGDVLDSATTREPEAASAVL